MNNKKLFNLYFEEVVNKENIKGQYGESDRIQKFAKKLFEAPLGKEFLDNYQKNNYHYEIQDLKSLVSVLNSMSEDVKAETGCLNKDAYDEVINSFYEEYEKFKELHKAQEGLKILANKRVGNQ
jgi:hypothetical protein